MTGLIIGLVLVIVIQGIWILGLRARNREAVERCRSAWEGHGYLLKVLHDINEKEKP